MKAGEIAEFLDGELHGDGDVEITSLAGIDQAGVAQIAFFDKAGELPPTEAACLIVTRIHNHPAALIVVSNPKLAFARIAEKILPFSRKFPGLGGFEDPTAIMAESACVRTADIGKFVTIGENSIVEEGCAVGHGTRIGKNVSIGKNTIIHHNCVIYDNVEIGSNCVIHGGTVIGADGFGYVTDEKGEHVKFPQIGTTVIEDHVEIGANSCIDRGALGETRIGAGTKIDNLVQIAHNVLIGKRVLIAAQTGISGSCVIEDDCVIGGQVGIGDHVHLKSGAIIGSQAGILPGKIVRPGVWWGTPIQPLDEYKKNNAHFRGMQRLHDEVDKLKNSIAITQRDGAK